MINKKDCKSFISGAISAYKLICLLDITPKKDRKTELLACNSTLF